MARIDQQAKQTSSQYFKPGLTFKDLQKLVESQQSDPEQASPLFEKLRGLPWIFDKDQHKLEPAC